MPTPLAARRQNLLSRRGGSLKRIHPVDANTFFLIARNPFSRNCLATSIVRGFANGEQVAGVVYDAWRGGPMRIVPTIFSDPTVAGLKYLAASSGARDYALNINSGSGGYFVGSYHGYETVIEQVILLDGVPYDPTTLLSVTFRRFKIRRKTLITGKSSELIYVDYYARMDDDNVWEEEHTFDSTATATGTGFVHLDFADPRFSQYSTDGVTYTALASGSGNTLGDTVRKLWLRDPISGDVKLFEWLVDHPLSGQYILYNTNYAKLYIPQPSGVMGRWNVKLRDTYLLAPYIELPSMPYTDTFDGSALSALWRLTNGTGLAASITVSVTGGAATFTPQGSGNNRYQHPISGKPGVYQVAIDYLTSSAQASGTFSIQRSDSGSNGGAIGSTVSFNSTSATTATLSVTVGEGETPYVMLDFAATTSRSVTISEMRITKTG